MSKSVILLIDDEKTVLDSLVNQLKNAFGYDYAYETASDVEEAWEILEEVTSEGKNVALIISDWLMPKQKGDEFLAEVYQKHPAIAQIMLSGYADDEAIARAHENCNLIAYIRKPWEEEEIVAAVKKGVS